MVMLTISMRRASRNEHIRSTFYDVSEGEESALPETDLPLPPLPVSDAPALSEGEARISDGRVSCPSCSSSLKMPEGREPPFKFKCPKCKESIRAVE